VVLVLALPVLYALSVGPVARLCVALEIGDDSPIIGRVLQVFYTPLGWVVDQYDPVKRFFAWYLELWGVPLG
jgi:hypothetical protein